MIPQEKVAEIRERNDIVALVQEYVPLKRAGASFRGLCPFHPEKTPSFYVHPQRQFFHCFGCGVSGDVFSFLSRVDGRPFPEVARTLAERAGVELPAMDAREESEYRRRQERDQRFAALMDAAAGFYVRQLREHPLGSMARDELDRRGIRGQVAESFRLGYAPHGWDALATFLRERGWSPADAEQLGLVIPRRGGSGHYDRFRHRLVFPITDVKGRIVAFSGRELDPPPDQRDEERRPGAKYVNSPEGPLYKKGEVLFGLQEGRVATRRQGWVIVCEGNFDLLALHQAGFENAVAPMGTALTESHAKLLRRFAEKVVLLFDGDDAGRRAARAAYPVLQQAGLAAHVVVLPPGSDPDSFLREQGSDALQARVDAAPGIVDFLVDDAAERAAGDARAKASGIAELGPVLAQVDNPIERRLYVERVARRFGIADVDAVRRQLNQGRRASRAGASHRGTARDQGPRGRSSRRRDAPNDAPHHKASLPVLECELVGAVLDQPALAASDDAKKLEELLTNSDLRAMFQTASRMIASRGVVDAPALLAELSGNPVCGWLEERLAVHKYDEWGAQRALRDGIPRLARRNIERELPRLQKLILQARHRGDDARAEELTRQFVALNLSSKKWMQGSPER